MGCGNFIKKGGSNAMLSYPDEMFKYIIPGVGWEGKPTLMKEAPEEFKELARKQNQHCLKYAGEVHWIIEGDEDK